MPTLPSVPSIATVSSTLIPISEATFPEYPNASPRLVTELKLLFAPVVNTSATLAASVALRPNWRIVAAMIPAASVASVPVALLRFKTANVISLICGATNPARPSSPMRFATSVAVNEVVRPSSSALSLSASKSTPFAWAIAPVIRIASSKLANFIAA